MSEQVQEDGTSKEQADHRFFRFIFWLSGGAGLIVVLAYLFWFSHLDVGGPHDWSAFGSYFSGMLTPVIALVSVYVLCRTLVVQQREFSKSVEALEHTAKINADNLVQQRRFFRLEEISQSLDKLKSSIQDHEITFIPDEDGMNFISKGEDASSLPQGSSKLKDVEGMLSKYPVTELQKWMLKLDTQNHFLVSLGLLSRKVEVIIGYLRLGGLHSLVVDEFLLLKRFRHKFKEPMQVWRNHAFAREFEDTVGRLTTAYHASQQRYQTEIDSLSKDK